MNSFTLSKAGSADGTSAGTSVEVPTPLSLSQQAEMVEEMSR